MATTDVLLQTYRAKNQHKIDLHQNRWKSGKDGLIKLGEFDSDELLGSKDNPSSLRNEVERLNPDRPAEYIVREDFGVTEQTSRSCTISTTDVNSATRVAITYETLVYDFHVDGSEFPAFATEMEMISHLGFAEVVGGKVMKVDELMTARKNQIVFNALQAAKTPATAYDARTPYAIASDAMQVPLAQEYDLYNTLGTVFELHGFDSTDGMNIGLGTLGLTNVKRQTQGEVQVLTTDAVNGSEAWQYQDKVLFMDNKMPAIAGVQYRGIAAAPASVGVVEMMPLPMRKNRVLRSGGTPLDGKRFETLTLPMTGREVGVYFESDCLNGKDVIYKWQLSIDFAVVTAYNADQANEANSIFEFHVLNS